MAHGHMQIGEVAERLGLSLRTIRYYEEVGLVTPSARSQGGFRLYTEAEILRLQVVMKMKPLDFTLEEMRELLDALDRLSSDETSTQVREQTLEQVERYRLAAQERCTTLRHRLRIAEEFAGGLSQEIMRQRAAAAEA